ncbi:LEA type 2 family protein [Reinekea thalattae]|uniref:LEA type 2 family protein n=1 Tax=Reinekea thalattae TaxID=2593301 RepID=A0A5C8ZD45_9GAMM|nr:LEA type 2 family protein [Reinekea thalattae]TXR54836.1 LEA type 2 family protein [Reinekea thalattae]
MRFFCILFLLLTAGCASFSVNDLYKEPTFNYQTTQLQQLSFSELYAKTQLTITNHNAYSLPIQSVTAQLMVAGEPIIALDSPIPTLAPSSTTSVELNWSLAYSALSDAAQIYLSENELPLTLALTPTFEVPVLGARSVNWQREFLVPIAKAPKVRVTDWKVSNISLSALTLSFDLAIDNPNVFSFVTEDWQLALNTENKNIASFDLNDGSIAAESATQKQVELTLGLFDLGIAALNGLKQGSWPDSLELDVSGDWRSDDLDVPLPLITSNSLKALF